TVPWFELNGLPQTIVGPQATITVTAAVTLVKPAFGSNSLHLSQSSINPTLGDRTLASDTVVMSDDGSTYLSGARVRFSVADPSGAVTELATGVVPASGFNLDWDGKINGQIVPAGVYSLR